jgi:hypothetical protein
LTPEKFTPLTPKMGVVRMVDVVGFRVDSGRSVHGSVRIRALMTRGYIHGFRRIRIINRIPPDFRAAEPAFPFAADPAFPFDADSPPFRPPP